MQWLIDNKEWVFSGIGVLVISIVFGLFMKTRQTSIQKQKSGKNSQNYQAARDIKIGKSDD